MTKIKKFNSIKTKNIQKNHAIIIVILIVLAVIFILLLKNSSSRGKDAVAISDILMDHHKISFAKDNIIDEEKLNEVKSMDYSEIKKSIGVQEDFCIFIQDESGSVILSKGSPNLNIDGISCN